MAVEQLTLGLDQEAAEEIFLSAIRSGALFVFACSLADLDPKATRRRLKVGKRDARRGRATGDAEFFLKFRKALANVETASLRVIERAASQNWKAAAWLLERKFPRRWGKKNLEPIRSSAVKVKPLTVARLVKRGAHG